MIVEHFASFTRQFYRIPDTINMTPNSRTPEPANCNSEKKFNMGLLEKNWDKRCQKTEKIEFCMIA